MGSLWSRCCDVGDEDVEIQSNGVNSEALLLRRTASQSNDWENYTPENERSLPAAIKMRMSQHLSKLAPATEEEEREYMVRSWSSGKLEFQPECMLCLDMFTEARPSALSLCACGVNRNKFHVDCLMEWRRKCNKTNCPVCDNELFVDTIGLTSASAVTAAAASSASAKAPDATSDE